MVQFLKYVAVRLFLGTFVALFAVYRLLSWVHESMYAGQTLDDSSLLIWSYLVLLLAVSLGMSLWGRVRFRWLLERELDRLSRQYHPKLLERAWRRLNSFLASSFFFNTSRERLTRLVNRRFGDILLGMRAEDERALSIYELVLAADPDNEAYFAFLVRAWSRRPRLSEPSLVFVRRRYHERPDDRLVGILSREYTLRGVLNFESERVLERCLQVYPEHSQKVLEFVIPRLVSFQRMDDNAARFYLAALGRGWGERVRPLLETLNSRYREKKRADGLALDIGRALKEGVRPAPAETAGGAGFFEAPVRPAAARESAESFDLVFSPGESAGKGPRLKPGSLVYQLAQRLLAGGRGAVGGGLGRRLRLVLLLALSLVLVFLLVSSGKRLIEAFGPASKTVKETPAEGAFSVQAGAFKDSLSAVALCEKLKSGGVQARVSPVQVGKSRLFSVQVGAFASDSAATAEAQRLVSVGLLSDWKVVGAAGQ
ncbi:SPOR domain-containing protein [bacterium]|nr:SPOR domain-containing protein [bacterium]